MKLKEEYQKLNETMPSMTMPEKLKESGKKFTEVLIELYQWPSWTKESWKAAWEEYELTWFKHKSLWEEATRNNEKITRRNTRIQVILEQTEEFQKPARRSCKQSLKMKKKLQII